MEKQIALKPAPSISPPQPQKVLSVKGEKERERVRERAQYKSKMSSSQIVAKEGLACDTNDSRMYRLGI